MKFFKKLLPIAAALSTSCIVAPIITSCSANLAFSTDKLDFRPSNQHAKSEYELTPLQVAQDYFSKPEYFIEDIVYERLHSINTDYLDKKQDSHYSDVEYSVKFQIKTIDIKEVELKRIETDDGWQYDVYGAYVNFTLTFNLNRIHTRTFSTEELEKGITKEVYKTVDSETYNSKLSNYYAYLYFDEETKKWSVGLYANKDNDWECEWSEEAYKATRNTVTRDGKEYTFDDASETKQSVVNSRKMESDDYREILDDIGAYQSYYLTNVLPKTTNN